MTTTELDTEELIGTPASHEIIAHETSGYPLIKWNREVYFDLSLPLVSPIFYSHYIHHWLHDEEE